MGCNHLLLERAKTYLRFRGELTPPNCRYDQLIGAWILQTSSELLVDTPFRKGPRTKKEDIETGEDQKAE